MLSQNNIDYSIERLSPYLFGVAVPDEYDRAMLFLRPQEFTESPSRKFRGKAWDLWTFVKWYAKQHNVKDSTFSYTKDYVGFNFSLKDALRCYLNLPEKYMSSYDLVFIEVLKEILRQVRSDADIEKTYIIGYGKKNTDIMRHELKHAAYFLNKKYRAAVRDAIRSIERPVLNKLCRNLRDMGYHSSVFETELQAYLGTADWKDRDFGKGVRLQKMRQIHKMIAESQKGPMKDFSKTLYPN